jgi:hypothetical protein
MTMRARSATICVAVLLALVADGCGEGKPTHAEARAKRVDQPVRRDSMSSRVGDVRLIGVYIQRPEGVHATGGNAQLFLTLADDGAPTSWSRSPRSMLVRSSSGPVRGPLLSASTSPSRARGWSRCSTSTGCSSRWSVSSATADVAPSCR